jgi:hypothetical protein
MTSRVQVSLTATLGYNLGHDGIVPGLGWRLSRVRPLLKLSDLTFKIRRFQLYDF